MSRRDTRLLLEDILDCIESNQSYTYLMSYDDFQSDSKTSDAVIYNLIKIGVATNRLSEDFNSSFVNVDWFALRGSRNRIAHDYLGTDLSTIWSIVERHLEQLKKDITLILNDI